VITEESLTPLDAPRGRGREARDQRKRPGSPPPREAVPDKICTERGPRPRPPSSSQR
jgi:hypothetical protein